MVVRLCPPRTAADSGGGHFGWRSHRPHSAYAVVRSVAVNVSRWPGPGSYEKQLTGKLIGDGGATLTSIHVPAEWFALFTALSRPRSTASL